MAPSVRVTGIFVYVNITAGGKKQIFCLLVLAFHCTPAYGANMVEASLQLIEESGAQVFADLLSSRELL
jgi:hypothetical protein